MAKRAITAACITALLSLSAPRLAEADSPMMRPPHGHDGGDQRWGHQRWGNQGWDNQGGNHGWGNQGSGNQGWGSRGFSGVGVSIEVPARGAYYGGLPSPRYDHCREARNICFESFGIDGLRYGRCIVSLGC